MKFFNHLQKLLSQVLALICVVVFAVLVFVVLWGALTRALDRQPAWTAELASFLLAWLSVLGGVLAYASNSHLGVDLLVSRFDPGTRRLTKLLTHVCIFVFGVTVFVIGGGLVFQDRLSSGQMTASLGIRRAWFYLVLPVGGVFIAFLALEKFLSIFQFKNREEESV